MLICLIISLMALYRSDFLGIDIFRIAGTSMEPTLYDGDYVVIDTKSQLFENGTVIVFESPSSGTYLVKRVVAYPYGNLSVDKLWVEGDNPKIKSDSRAFGAINKDNVIGIVQWAF